ncbi:helix-turn-helix transcriptional regulator [Roseburia hominis]
MNVGKSILAIRKKKNMSQEEFGRVFHVTRQTVSNWENEKSYPDLQTLIYISDMFEVSLDQLIREDKEMVRTIDKERKTAKKSRIVIGILAVILIIMLLLIRFWIKAFEATPYEMRNQTEADMIMYLDFPDATPSGAIVRTFHRDDYENRSNGKAAKIRDEIGGSIEGDIPAFHLGVGQVIRPVFQNSNELKNLTPDSPPRVAVKEYGPGMLPLDDYEEEFCEWETVLQKDNLGYYLEYESHNKAENEWEEGGVTCLIEVYYTINGRDYVSVSAFNAFSS